MKQSALITILGDRPIAYHPVLARLFDSVTAAVFLSQLLYWHGLGALADGWIWKTQAEMTAETGLSRSEQETSRRILAKSGVVTEKLAGVPAKLYYRVNLDVLERLLAEYEPGSKRGGEQGPPQTSLRESSKLVCGNPANKPAVTPQTITETTTETTSERERASRADVHEVPVEATYGDIGGRTHPAIVKLRDITHVCPSPTGEAWAAVCDAVAPDAASIRRWTAAVRAWVLCGNKVSNVAGMIDWYQTGKRDNRQMPMAGQGNGRPAQTDQEEAESERRKLAAWNAQRKAEVEAEAAARVGGNKQVGEPCD